MWSNTKKLNIVIVSILLTIITFVSVIVIKVKYLPKYDETKEQLKDKKQKDKEQKDNKEENSKDKSKDNKDKEENKKSKTYQDL